MTDGLQTVTNGIDRGHPEVWQVSVEELLRNGPVAVMMSPVNGRIFLIFSLLLIHFVHAQAPTPKKASPTAKPDPKTVRLFEIKTREATTAFDAEDFATAQKRTEEAEAIIPNAPATLILRGALLYKAKKYDEALAAFQELIVRDANSYPGYFNSAEVYFAQKKYDLALAGFQRILDARPGDEMSQYRIVLILAFQGKTEEARQRADKIPKPGQTAAYYYAHAAIEFIGGHPDKGEQWIKQSETFFPPESSVSLRSVLVEHDLIKK